MSTPKLVTLGDVTKEISTIIERTGFTEAYFNVDQFAENCYKKTHNGYVRLDDYQFLIIANLTGRNFYQAEIGVNAHEDGFTLNGEVTPANDQYNRIQDFEIVARNTNEANERLWAFFDDMGMDMDAPISTDELEEDMYLVLLTIQDGPKITAEHLKGLSPSMDD